MCECVYMYMLCVRTYGSRFVCARARVCVCGGDWASLARMYMCEGGGSSEISCVLVTT